VSAAEPVRIIRARTPKAMEAFLRFPYRLRARDARWAPPPLKDQRELLDRRSHPFHEHAQVEYFLALRGGRVAGRIAAIENFAHNAAWNERCGHFGFLDAEDDPAVFAALLRAAERWCLHRGLDVLRGPCSFSTNEECGLLVEGHDLEHTLMTPHNPRYYQARIEAAGYTKAKDLHSYLIDRETYTARIPGLAAKVRGKLAERGMRIRIRTLDMSRFDEEVGRIRHIYNSAWEKNWGFVPMTDAELRHMAHSLRPIAQPETILFAESGGKPVAVLLALPDYNIVLRHMEGKQGPLQVAMFLLLRRHIKRVRLMAMGVVREYRARGLEALMIAELDRRARKLGITEAELGWVLEDNRLMNSAIFAAGARRTKVHRIYGKRLA
jgi:GNAT superfamily N-acetyltransferase